MVLADETARCFYRAVNTRVRLGNRGAENRYDAARMAVKFLTFAKVGSPVQPCALEP